MAEHALHRTVYRRRRPAKRIGKALGSRHLLAISYTVCCIHWQEAYILTSRRATIRGLNKATTFFLNVLSNHPSEDLQHLAEALTTLIESRPRLENFTSEREFAHSTRRWRDQVQALRIDLDRIPESRRFDGSENWWERTSDIVGILEGRGDVLRRVCEDLGCDWKEVCVAWGVFVDPRMRRNELL